MSSIFRVEKSKDYTTMSNHHLKNRGLSLKAKGLLSLILSLPEDWDYSVAGLTAICAEGRDAVRAAVLELENAGYIRREQAHGADSGRFAGYDYVVYETPVLPLTEKPSTENPSTEKPSTEKPSTENPTQLNTKQLNTKKINSIASKSPNVEEQLAEYAGDDAALLKALLAYADMRHQKRKTIATARTVELLTAKLDMLSGGRSDVKIAILNRSVENCWTGVFPLDSSGGVSPPREEDCEEW